MERKQRLAMIFAMTGVAIGTGHLVQQNAASNAEQAALAAAPTQIQQVSAGPETPALPQAASPVQPAPATVAAVEPVSPPAAVTATETAPPAPPVIVADLSPSLLPARPAPLQSTPIEAAPPIIEGPAEPVATPIPTPPAPAQTVAPTVPAVAHACAPSLRLAAAPQAMIGVSLVAPCAKDARVVIGHEGLSITGKTNAEGSLFLSLPALAVEATVTARLQGADEVEATVRVPAMATLRRMGVQWHDADAFQLHAFENGAGYGEPGHISAAKPQTPTTGLAGTGGFITLLGDASVDLPMMAEVYTFPAGIAANADIMIESAVTDATCGRELLGETIMTLAGEVYITELTLAMPDCEAVGDILVLKNLLTDLTIAAAN
jgi:hypothetical protein